MKSVEYLLKGSCLQEKVCSEFLCLLDMVWIPLALDDKHDIFQFYNKWREKQHVRPFIRFLWSSQRFPIETDDI